MPDREAPGSGIAGYGRRGEHGFFRRAAKRVLVSATHFVGRVTRHYYFEDYKRCIREVLPTTV